jgi:hypothetical protein
MTPALRESENRRMSFALRRLAHGIEGFCRKQDKLFATLAFFEEL